MNNIPVKILSDGSIIVFNKVCCDGYVPGLKAYIYSHIHSDHIKGVSRAVKYCNRVYASKATSDILKVLKGVRGVKGLDYGVRVRIDDISFWLYKTRHIIGSAGIVFEDGDLRIVYSGDFKLPGTEVIPCDILIIEATYGSPEFIRPPTEFLEEVFVKVVSSFLRRSNIVIYGYYGKVQEAMEILRSYGVPNFFIVSRRLWMLTKIAIRHGANIYDVAVEGSHDAQEACKSSHVIFFRHLCEYDKSFNEGKYVIHLTGWIKGVIRRIHRHEYAIALSDHADFNQLLEYISEAKPKLVIVDGSRSVFAKIFAREVWRRLKIRSIVMP